MKRLPVLNMEAAAWHGLRPRLEHELARMILHVGEPGPFAHCFAALDMAMADISARTASAPLARLLGVGPPASVNVYASTPDVTKMDESIAKLVDDGHNAAKLKIGFDTAHDEAVLARFRKVAPPKMALMVDANQNWSTDTAPDALMRISEWAPEFVEEPIRADVAPQNWAALASGSPVALAAGENILSAGRFAELVELGGLQVVQPDVAKWAAFPARWKWGVTRTPTAPPAHSITWAPRSGWPRPCITLRPHSDRARMRFNPNASRSSWR